MSGSREISDTLTRALRRHGLAALAKGFDNVDVMNRLGIMS
ncbi:MAG: hypothetical protein WB471_09320 [Nocardioides sp.]